MPSPLPEKYANRLIGVIGDDHILIAVAVEVAGGDEFDLITGAINFLALESSIAVTEQHTHSIDVVVDCGEIKITVVVEVRGRDRVGAAADLIRDEGLEGAIAVTKREIDAVFPKKSTVT